MFNVEEVCKKAKEASYILAGYTSEQKNRMLEAVAVALEENKAEILKENAVDLKNYTKQDSVFVDRLTLTGERIDTMIEGVRQIISLPDPVGEIVETFTNKAGLELKRVRAPLGVIAIIYEARPNVTVDAAALCLKSGNAVVLRGGKDAICSNRALYNVMRNAIAKAGMNPDCVAFIDDISRESSKDMLGQGKYIDVCIPRGGEGLKHFVLENATMPVIASSGGNCHVYVEKTADLEMAKNIVFNAKTQRPSVCNAAEHLIVDEAICEKFLPMAYDALSTKNVEIVGDERARKVLPKIGIMTDEDYGTEYEAYKMSFAVVNGVKEAVDMINKYSTNHSDAIITKDEFAKNYFEKNVDSACVYVNASTRFTDGFEFGLGAEMGISTQKLHARGPIALKELTSVKYVIEGNGQVRT